MLHSMNVWNNVSLNQFRVQGRCYNEAIKTCKIDKENNGLN